IYSGSHKKQAEQGGFSQDDTNVMLLVSNPALISQLTPEQFTQSVGGSYGSIRNTLVHAMSAEWGWLDRCGGAKRGPALKPDDYPTLESLTAMWSKVDGYVSEFLSPLKDADLARNVEYVTENGQRSMPLGELMHHGANHAVHHR